jgi:hypothetical protein
MFELIERTFAAIGLGFVVLMTVSGVRSIRSGARTLKFTASNDVFLKLQAEGKLPWQNPPEGPSKTKETT